MSRTNTTSQTTFTRPGQVTYTLPSPQSTTTSTAPTNNPSLSIPPTAITITLPPNSPWTSGLHWHETHTEYLLVTKGAALITANNVARTYRPRDGPITIPPYTRHEWHRAPPTFNFSNKRDAWSDVEDVVVVEWTDPADGQKEVFFRNLQSVIADEVRRADKTGGWVRNWWVNVQLWCLFGKLDNWPVFVKGPRWVEYGIAHLWIWVSSLAGRWVWGLKGWYDEYTPERLREVEDRKRI